MLVNAASHQEFMSSSLAQHSNKFQKNVFSSVCLRNLAERQTEIIPLVTWKIGNVETLFMYIHDKFVK